MWNNTYLTETSTHYHVTNSWDYFKATFGRNGMDGHGGLVRALSNLKIITSNGVIKSNNAQYFSNSVFGNDVVYFGFSPTNYDLGMEPSIVGHEFTHGITHYVSKLGKTDEPGSLNESFSDIFGTVIQAQTLEQGYTDWIIGNKIPDTKKFERSLIYPNTRGTHWSGQYDNNGDAIINELGQPWYYQGTYWCSCPSDVDYGGVHINGGVQNKWFQVLTDGNSSVQGIGMSKAAKITFFALKDYIVEGSQYVDSKESTIKAAIDWFGKCSQAYKSVIDAWNYVGIYAYNDCQNTSVKQFEAKEISVYPNPTSSTITIELPIELNKPIKVYDITGKKVKEFKGNGLEFKINLSTLEKGMYFLHFNLGDQELVKRVIVQ